MTDTMVKAGDVAVKMTDRWRWWQAALADPSKVGSKELPVHDGDAQQGYYRTRFKDGPWQPVAIFYDEQDNLIAYRDGREVNAADIWTFACRNPISYEQYQKASAGEGFDDEPPAPTIGHNSGDDDPFEAIQQELSGETEMAAEFLRSEIKTQTDADKAGVWAKRLTDLSKRADNHRVVEKEPHLIASRAVDDKWRDPIAQAKEWAAKLKKHVEPFLVAQRRAEEARQRKARDEAEAARRAAAEAARKAQESDQQSEQDRKAAQAEAQRLADEAKKADQEAEARRVNAGRTGARVSVRVEKIGVVTDYGKAAAALVAMNHKDLIETIDKLAQRAAKAGMPFEGMEVREQEKVV